MTFGFVVRRSIQLSYARVPRRAVLAVVKTSVQTSWMSLWFLVALERASVAAGSIAGEFIDVSLLFAGLQCLETKEAFLFEKADDLFCEAWLSNPKRRTKGFATSAHDVPVNGFFLFTLFALGGRKGGLGCFDGVEGVRSLCHVAFCVPALWFFSSSSISPHHAVAKSDSYSFGVRTYIHRL